MSASMAPLNLDDLGPKTEAVKDALAPGRISRSAVLTQLRNQKDHTMDGIIAAVPTPIDVDFSPIKAAFLEHCTWALSNGCDGLNILGTTGEANSFPSEARAQVMGWAATALPTDRLMVGTGTPSLEETIHLTSLADDLGYPVALVLPPYYYKPASDEGLLAWYRALHQALSDRAIRIFFYNFPQMTGFTIPVPVIAALARDLPERFAGIKDSSGDLDYCRAIRAAAPQMDVFPSSETTLDRVVQDGFAGCISATVNITAPICGEVWRHRDDPPADQLAELDRQRSAMAGPNLIASVKHMVGIRSEDANWGRVLPPLLPLSDAQARSLQSALSGG